LRSADSRVLTGTRAAGILVSRAADTYVLGSIEKLGTVSSYTVVGLPEVAGIITGAPADHPTLQQLRKRGVDIIQAS
jgi:DeoR/GlpR family transcriptional regulator of sugar metabolism